jgi:hypothetical protein
MGFLPFNAEMRSSARSGLVLRELRFIRAGSAFPRLRVEDSD